MILYICIQRGVYIMLVRVRLRSVYIRIRLTHSSEGRCTATGAVDGLKYISDHHLVGDSKEGHIRVSSTLVIIP